MNCNYFLSPLFPHPPPPSEHWDCGGEHENRDCLREQWLLNVVSEQFLLFQSAAFPTHYLAVTNGRMVLTSRNYLFSGIKSKFFVGVNLVSKTTEPRGEVVLSYYNRRATISSGFVCHEGWGKEEADTICRSNGFEEGLPTYKSHYMNISDALFVASNFKCRGQERSLLECKSDNACRDQSTGCLAQQGVNLNDGICTGADVAGVVCGSREEIVKELQKVIQCDEVLEERSYVGYMFHLKQEIAYTKQIVFSNKGWGEYVEPFPETDGQVSLVIIEATGLNRSMDLRAPMTGWQFLKGPDLWTGLVQMATSLNEAFKSASDGMATINYNTQVIHREIIFMARSAFLKDNGTLFESIDSIRNLTADSEMLMKESYSIFDKMAHMLRELVGGLKSNNKIEGEEAIQLKKAFNVLNASLIANGEKKRKLEAEQTTAMVVTTELYNKIESTVNKYCESYFTDITEVCHSCAHRGPTDECVRWGQRCAVKKPAKCIQSTLKCEIQNNKCNDPYTACAEYGSECTKQEKDRKWWSLWIDYNWKCVSWSNPCVRRESRCRSYSPSCKAHKEVCTQEREDCQQEEDYCLEYKPGGQFCLDAGWKRDKPCQKGSLCGAMKQVQKKGFELLEIINKESLEQDKNDFIDDHVQSMLSEMTEIVVQINTSYIGSPEKATSLKEDLMELTDVLDKLLKSLSFSYGNSLKHLKKNIERAELQDIYTLNNSISNALSTVKFHRNHTLNNSQKLVSDHLTRLTEERFSATVRSCRPTCHMKSNCFEWKRSCDQIIHNCVKKIDKYNSYYHGVEPKNCERFQIGCRRHSEIECTKERQFKKCEIQCSQVPKRFSPLKPDFHENIEDFLQSAIDQAKSTKQLEAHKKVIFTECGKQTINLNSTAFNNDEISYIFSMTQSLTNLYRHWAQLDDLFSSLKVLIDVFQYKAKVSS